MKIDTTNSAAVRPPFHRSARVLLTAAALGAAACQVLKPVVAPGSSVLLIVPNVSYVAAGTETTVRVRAQGLDGSALRDGTEVLLTASQGTLLPQKVRVQSGEATTTYTASSNLGRVVISAVSGDANGEATLDVGSAPIGSVSLSADRTTLPSTGGDIDVTALVRSPSGEPVNRAPVEVQATNGAQVRPSGPWFTESDGRVKVRVSTTRSGLVRGVSGAAVSELNITLRQPVSLTLTSNKNPSTKATSVTFTVKALAGGTSAVGRARIDFGDGQSFEGESPAGGPGSANIPHVYTSVGTFNVTVRFFEAPENTETSATLNQSVIDLPIIEPPTPPPPPGSSGDQIDPSLITWVGNANISNWAVTATITNWSYGNGTTCIYHTRQGSWPLVSIDDQPPNIEAQIGFVAKINGKWYGGAYDWMGQGRTCKFEPPENWGRDQIREYPLDASYPGPRSGDEVGLYMSTPASFRIPVRSVNERTNIVLVRWP